ncbi:MAG TPA: preprotein translocase subunit YajC [Cytophagaceae bacterium]|jgi:preprotein translocase subunit YajC|nr:preprotein translocase subunit YajC [Cytophagaceae bacterium]
MFNILLQAQKGMDWGSLIFFPLIIVVFYFFMIRPQQKKSKEQKVFRENIKKGDNIVTVGGLHGKIASLENDDTFILEVDKGIKLKFEKSAISLEASKKYQATQ